MNIRSRNSKLEKNYEKCLTTAELSLALSPEMYPIATVYLHIVAAIALANMKQMDEARQHIGEAWEIAQPDDLIEAFGEHHGLLQGLIEVYFKKNDPAAFERIIAIAYVFSANWRKIHHSETGHDVADNLTTTEFTIAMLYSRGWQAKEIAKHLSVSERTVSNRLSDIFVKLGVGSRTELKKFMLTYIVFEGDCRFWQPLCFGRKIVVFANANQKNLKKNQICSKMTLKLPYSR